MASACMQVDAISICFKRHQDFFFLEKHCGIQKSKSAGIVHKAVDSGRSAIPREVRRTLRSRDKTQSTEDQYLWDMKMLLIRSMY
jgi:hypothetical protein